MLQEGIYTLSELKAALRESETKNEFKPKLGDGVEKGNKKNNGEAVATITKETGKYNGKKMEHTVVSPDDRNKTTLDVIFNELEPSKQWKERVQAQVEGYPSVENKKNIDAKDNGGIEYEGNEKFYQDREKLGKNRKEAIKDDMDAGLKGRELKKYNVVNESIAFDWENDQIVDPDTVAKDFIRWATTEAETNHEYPINAMQLVYDAYVNNDNDALEELITSYFEHNYSDMAQYDDVAKGVEKAVNAFGYYNLSNEKAEQEQNASEEETATNNTEAMSNDDDNITEPEPLDENKTKGNTQKAMKRLHYKNTTFLTEAQMLKRIPEEYKTDGNKFYVKDASGTEYMVECTVDNRFGVPSLTVSKRLNEAKANDEIKRMKELFGYNSSEYFTKADNGAENLSQLHEQLEKVKSMDKIND